MEPSKGNNALNSFRFSSIASAVVKGAIGIAVVAVVADESLFIKKEDFLLFGSNMNVESSSNLE